MLGKVAERGRERAEGEGVGGGFEIGHCILYAPQQCCLGVADCNVWLQAFAAFDRVIARFMHGDHEDDVKRRHNTFKLIPRVTKGSWVIRNAVGSTPVLLGKKLTTKYFRYTIDPGALVLSIASWAFCYAENEKLVFFPTKPEGSVLAPDHVSLIWFRMKESAVNQFGLLRWLTHLQQGSYKLTCTCVTCSCHGRQLVLL